MDQSTRDHLRFLSQIEDAYDDSIVSLRVALGRLESTPGARGASKHLEKAIQGIDRFKAPVSAKIREIRAENAANAPKREGWQSLG